MIIKNQNDPAFLSVQNSNENIQFSDVLLSEIQTPFLLIWDIRISDVRILARLCTLIPFYSWYLLSTNSKIKS